ncbi:MAG: hypothetical protein GY759_23585 [Chloroflexi bacterium]|nr:hypothetical protein [Chloroflexota bacterium]
MELTPYRQEHPHTCLPACARIVLQYLGHEHTESELASAFTTIEVLGIRPEDAVQGIENLGYRAL